MIDAIGYREHAKIKWINAFQAANIVGVNLRVGAALVMCVNATNFAEVMLCQLSIELIQR